MLSVATVLAHDGVKVSDVRCRHHAGRGQDGEQTDGHAVVFVRRGRFRRTADGFSASLDATNAFCMRPGESQRYDHPCSGGDDCTSITLDEDVLATVAGDGGLPTGLLITPPAVDLAHRRLLAAARRGIDVDTLAEHALALVVDALSPAEPRPAVAPGRPATARARRALVAGAREALAEDPDRSLRDLAGLLVVSPHHLSRVFKQHTGATVARHRMRLRTRLALERLGDGERDLGRLAVDSGFADQSHLCRVMRDELGTTPRELRALLTGARAS